MSDLVLENNPNLDHHGGHDAHVQFTEGPKLPLMLATPEAPEAHDAGNSVTVPQLSAVVLMEK
jgi:hypothetical protein